MECSRPDEEVTMEILSQTIRQTRYYGPDVMPYVMISRRGALSDLQATYHFE